MRGPKPPVVELSAEERLGLERVVRAFIAYYNRTMAKPFEWTYQGKALVA